MSLKIDPRRRCVFQIIFSISDEYYRGDYTRRIRDVTTAGGSHRDYICFCRLMLRCFSNRFTDKRGLFIIPIARSNIVIFIETN